MKREYVALQVKLAAALLKLGDIRYNHAKQMTAEQLCSLYEFQHNIPHGEDGPDEFWNLTPMLKSHHREVTAKFDVPRIAKNKRVAAKHLAHLERLQQKGK